MVILEICGFTNTLVNISKEKLTTIELVDNTLVFKFNEIEVKINDFVSTKFKQPLLTPLKRYKKILEDFEIISQREFSEIMLKPESLDNTSDYIKG